VASQGREPNPASALRPRPTEDADEDAPGRPRRRKAGEIDRYNPEEMAALPQWATRDSRASGAAGSKRRRVG